MDGSFLQIRPMVADTERFAVEITRQEMEQAICRSTQSLGNAKNEVIADIVYVKPNEFKVEATLEMVGEIGKINAGLLKKKRPYLLVGPGRWGSADRWLGIPVQWRHISGVGAIIELRNEKLKADPSQGSHFFQNITSLGIPYITVTEDSDSGEYFLADHPGDNLFAACSTGKTSDTENRRQEISVCDNSYLMKSLLGVK